MDNLEARIDRLTPMDTDAEDALDLLEELHYMCGTISYDVYMKLLHLWADRTGDRAILSNR